MTTTSTTTNSYLKSLQSSSTSSSSSSASTSATASGTLDMTSFLKLLTTQLQTQDPTEPVDNTQMVAQMAQFSSVAGISQMNTTLTNMASDLSASRLGGAASWIGKTALTASDIVTPLTDGSYNGTVTLPSAASAVTIKLTDTTGAVVHTETLGSTASGETSFTWNGKASDGTTVAASGPLAITVSATDTTGAAMTTTTSAWVPVLAVESPSSGTTKLTTALGNILPSAVTRLG